MKQNALKSAGFIALGSIALVMLVLSLSPGFMTKVFAEDIGAKQPPVKMNEHVRALNNAFEEVSKAVVPSVVSISVVIENKGMKNQMHDEFKDFFKFFGQPNPDESQQEDQAPQESEASGSGVIVTDNGYIVTNYHVVENAKEIKVTTNDKKEHKAKLICTDPFTDLAVIKIERSGFPMAYIGNIEDVKIGEWVLAVGNPLGLNSTVTAGIVSAIGRGGLSILRDRGPSAVENFIQTDAAINPGNSGGGLFNLEGSLVGINTAIATRTGSYIGYGFAIPIDLVKSVITDLIQNGKISRGQIGVMIRSVDELMAKSLGLNDVAGVLVNDVIKNSAADKAGIESGDVILELDGKTLSTSNELQSIVAKKKAGDNVNMVIWRDGKKINKQVKLQARETKDDTATKEASKGDDEDMTDNANSMNFDKLGFTVKPLTSDDKENYDVQNGVIISKVDRNGEAIKRGIVPNGIIIKADRTKITSMKELKKVISEKKSGDAVMLQIKYKDANRIVALEIP